MGFKPLTVNTPVEDLAHILAEDDATLYDSIIGSDCVLPVGALLNASIISNNNIRITDGMVVVGGHVGRIVKGDYEDMAIANGVSGQNRNDLIVARFISGGTGGADTYSLVVVQGIPGTSAEDPATVQGDLYAGETQRDYPLWRVRIEGLSVVGLDKLYEVGILLAGKVNVSDIIDNLTTAEKKKPLSANQGKVLSGQIGTLTSLTTDNKNNLVSAINEVDVHANTAQSTANTNKANIGTLSSLKTAVKTSIVNAINNMHDNILDSLSSVVANTTTKKIAGALAVKELNNKLSDSGRKTLVTDGTGYISYRLKSGWCAVYISAGNASGTLKTAAGQIKRVATLPSGYRPDGPVRIPLSWQSSDNSTIFALVESDGGISVYAATKSSNYYVGEIVFPVA